MGKDCGIDLVYEDKQGKHWAIQSKCVSPEREISKAEIDSSLSESSDSRIHGRLLIASTDGIGKTAKQVIDRQEKQVVCFLLEHFRQSEVDFHSSPEDLSTDQMNIMIRWTKVMVEMLKELKKKSKRYEKGLEEKVR
jgi:predicted helicase